MADSCDGNEGRVRVICRVRPHQEGFKSEQFQPTVDVDPHLSFVRVAKNRWDSPEAFAYDAVLPVKSSQRQVYDVACSHVVDSVIKGRNGTVLPYGSTGSGKTHTLLKLGAVDKHERGLVIRAVEDIFSRVAAERHCTTCLTLSYVQMYNEEVYDLLDHVDDAETHRYSPTSYAATPLRLTEHPNTGEVSVEGASSIRVMCPNDVLEVLATAERRRVLASRAINVSSSRSHSVLTVNIRREPASSTLNSALQHNTNKIVFVDLASSERVKHNGSTGELLCEAVHINRSLAALGKCVNVLAEASGNLAHLPYRDSKLTHLLQDCFGETSCSSLIITCSQDPRHVTETVSSLRFGLRAMRVKNTAKLHNVAEHRAAVKVQAAEVGRLKKTKLVKETAVSSKEVGKMRSKSSDTGSMIQSVQVERPYSIRDWFGASRALEKAGPHTLVQILSSAALDETEESTEVRRAVLRALATITSDRTRHPEIMKAGAVQALMTLLDDNVIDEKVRIATLAVIANLATSLTCHDDILDDHSLPALLNLMKAGNCASTQTRTLVTGTLANLMGNPDYKDKLVRVGALELLFEICTDREAARSSLDMYTQSARGIANFTTRNPNSGQAVLGIPGGIDALTLAVVSGPSLRARKYAAVSLYHLSRCPGLSHHVNKAGGLHLQLTRQTPFGVRTSPARPRRCLEDVLGDIES